MGTRNMASQPTPGPQAAAPGAPSAPAVNGNQGGAGHVGVRSASGAASSAVPTAAGSSQDQPGALPALPGDGESLNDSDDESFNPGNDSSDGEGDDASEMSGLASPALDFRSFSPDPSHVPLPVASAASGGIVRPHMVGTTAAASTAAAAPASQPADAMLPVPPIPDGEFMSLAEYLHDDTPAVHTRAHLDLSAVDGDYLDQALANHMLLMSPAKPQGPLRFDALPAVDDSRESLYAQFVLGCRGGGGLLGNEDDEDYVPHGDLNPKPARRRKKRKRAAGGAGARQLDFGSAPSAAALRGEGDDEEDATTADEEADDAREEARVTVSQQEVARLRKEALAAARDEAERRAVQRGFMTQAARPSLRPRPLKRARTGADHDGAVPLR